MPIGYANFPVLNDTEGIVNPLANALNAGLNAYKGINEARYQVPNLESALGLQKAETNSKNAYSQLVAPQYMAKLFGNPDILANLPEDQKRQVLQKLLNPANVSSQLQVQSSPLANQMQQIPTQQSMSPMQQGSIASQTQATNDTNTYHPQFPVYENGAPGEGQQPPKTFAQNVGDYKGSIAQGLEAGKLRAQDIKGLNDTVFNTDSNQTTLDTLSNILGSPEFDSIRKSPIKGHTELAYYSKFGTPEQKNLVGQYFTLTGNLVKDSARDFAGQFRKGEQQLLEGMKPSGDDTPDTARGKTETISYLNRMINERSKLTSQLMSKYQINKLEAEQQADKMIDGNAIRSQIHSILYSSKNEDKSHPSNFAHLSDDDLRKIVNGY